LAQNKWAQHRTFLWTSLVFVPHMKFGKVISKKYTSLGCAIATHFKFLIYSPMSHNCLVKPFNIKSDKNTSKLLPVSHNLYHNNSTNLE